jgi:thiamine biosynthesis lipoprotein
MRASMRTVVMRTTTLAFRCCGLLGLLGLLVGHVPRAAAQAPAGNARPTKVQYSDSAMGTNVTVWLWTADERGAAQAAEAVFDEMKRLDQELTTWDARSEISQINTAAGGKPVKVSAETYAVIERALDISKRSKGLFDISVEAFKGLWKFDEDMDGTLPDPADVKKRLALVNWKDIVLDPKQHSVVLRRKGFTDFMMQAGGDMYVAGKKGPDRWTVAIRDPRGPVNTFFAVAPVEDHSFSTSGDYERGFVGKDGVRYHHIIDPRTGMPAHASRSVTVRAKDAFTADAWSKVMFIMGPRDAIELIKREHLTDFEVVWVDDQNKIVTTDGLNGVITVLKEPTPGP